MCPTRAAYVEALERYHNSLSQEFYEKIQQLTPERANSVHFCEGYLHLEFDLDVRQCHHPLRKRLHSLAKEAIRLEGDLACLKS